MGGEAREIWEQIGNDNWGQEPYMNGYFDERYMFYFDVHYGTHVRTFVELKSGLNSFRIGGPRPIDEKKLDFQAAFLEVGTGDDRNWIKFRAGRHEMEYGSGRLIDVREGPNVRLSFDGFKVKTGIGPWHIDGFAVRPDQDNPGFFDNAPDHAVGFWGVYGVRPLKKSLTLDTYYLGLDRKTAAFNRGVGPEVRHSIGARLSRPVAQTKSGWDFDYEALAGSGVDRSQDCLRTIVRRDSGCYTPSSRIDRDGKRGAKVRGVVEDHWSQLQLVKPLAGQCETNQTPGVGSHKIDQNIDLCVTTKASLKQLLKTASLRPNMTFLTECRAALRRLAGGFGLSGTSPIMRNLLHNGLAAALIFFYSKNVLPSKARAFISF